MAMKSENADGCVIHMLLGKLKKGDIPADVRDAAIRKMVELYFEPNSAIVTGYGYDMLYAGPREALLHAIFRQNMGATTLITGRDHAGVGDYYGPFDAQTVITSYSIHYTKLYEYPSAYCSTTDSLRSKVCASPHVSRSWTRPWVTPRTNSLLIVDWSCK